MKNYTEQELESISTTISNNNKVIDDSISWANKNLKYEEQSNLILSLKNSKKILSKINENLKNKPVIALFGGSQVGKSYLIKNLLSVEGKPFLIENNFQKYDFLKDINPPGVGAESTGVVTRFTKEKKGVFPCLIVSVIFAYVTGLRSSPKSSVSAIDNPSGLSPSICNSLSTEHIFAIVLFPELIPPNANTALIDSSFSGITIPKSVISCS